MDKEIKNTPTCDICQPCCPNVKIDKIEEGMTGKEVADLLYNNFDKLNKSKANKCVERKVRHLLRGENGIYNETAKNKFIQQVFYTWSKKDYNSTIDYILNNAPSIEVGTTTTLPAGSQATVTATKDGRDAVLNFGIPKGDKGDQGIKGDSGVQLGDIVLSQELGDNEDAVMSQKATTDKFTELSNKLIKLVHIGNWNSAQTYANKIGDYFYAGSNKIFKRISTEDLNSPDSTESWEIKDGSIFTYADELYVYNGTTLVRTVINTIDEAKQYSDGLYDEFAPNISWEQGSFNGLGEDVDSEVYIRTNKVATSLNFVVTFDENIYIVAANFSYNSEDTRKNENLKSGEVYSQYGPFVRFALKRIDGTNPEISEAQNIRIEMVTTTSTRKAVEHFNRDITEKLDGIKLTTSNTTAAGVYYTYHNKLKFKKGDTLVVSASDNFDFDNCPSISVEYRINSEYISKAGEITKDNRNLLLVMPYEYDITVKFSSLAPLNDTNYVTIYASVKAQLTAESERLDGRIDELVKSNYGIKKIIDWEQGSINGNGEDAANETRYRSPKIPINKGDRILLLLPPNLNYSINRYNPKTQSRENLTNIYWSIGLDGQIEDDFVRISVGHKDGTLPTMEDINTAKYVILPPSVYPSQYNVIIASSDSSEADKAKADIVCGEGDVCRIINAAVNINFQCTQTLLLAGTYILDEVLQVETLGLMKGNDCCILSYTPITSGNGGKKATVIDGVGIASFDLSNSGITTVTTTVFREGDEVASHPTTVSLFRVSSKYEDTNGASILFGVHLFKMKNFQILCKDTKPLVCVDGLMASAFVLDNARILADTTVHPFYKFPVDGLIGVRGVQGSNNGIHNKISKVLCLFFYKGFDMGGEHFILEDCLAHHCYYGYSWGDYECRIQLEHPNMMIGCSAEQCFYLMKLGRYGCTTEEELEELGKQNQTQPFICLCMSIEGSFETSGMSEQGYEDGWHSMKGIHEVFPGKYYGTMEVEYLSNKLFDNSNGDNFIQRMIKLPISGNKSILLTRGEQTYMQRFFDTMERKWITCIEPFANKWVYDDGTEVSLSQNNLISF